MKDLMAVGQTGGIPGMINRNAQKEYLKKMYNNNQLSESQLNYFYDKMGF